jgi:hypothetical protein
MENLAPDNPAQIEIHELANDIHSITNASIWKALDNLWYHNVLDVWIYVLCISNL